MLTNISFVTFVDSGRRFPKILGEAIIMHVELFGKMSRNPAFDGKF
jgi:hypothetical protein